MNTTKRLVIVAVLALGWVLAACGPSAPAAETPSLQSPAYPGLEGYPPPAQIVEQEYNPYPGPSAGVKVFSEWSVAEAALMAGQVQEIYQNATFHVTLVLKDGSVVLAKEPAQDELVNVIQRCGAPCQGLEVVKE